MKFSRIVLLALVLQAPVLSAATVVWSSAQNISGDTDVSTTGTLVIAANVGSSTATTVNTVTFAAFNGTAAGVAVDTLNNQPGGVYGNANAPYNTLTSAYQALVNSGRYSDGATLETLTFSNLTAGNVYQIQLWVNDSRSGGFSRRLDITAGATGTIEYNVGNAAGGLGQFITGTFTADGTMQTFNLLGAATGPDTASTQLNGFQLRQIAVPEPGPAMLLPIAAMLGFSLRRRRA